MQPDPVTIRPARGRVTPHQARWHQRLAAAVIYGAISGVAATLRGQYVDHSGLITTGKAEPLIFATWHNRLALSLILFRDYVQKNNPGRRMAALVSASKDGALLARILERFGVQPVRGSSSRRGPQALLELTSWIERGYDVAFTPDGPRGPRYVVQEGALALAQLSGRPVVPASYYLRRKLTLRSWDRFQVPLPFTWWQPVFGRPIYVPREAGDAEREALRQALGAELNAITRD